MTIAEWVAAGQHTGDFWVLDTDGWAYWANALLPNTSTANIMESVQLTSAEADANKEFVFTITFSDGGSYPYSLDGGAAQPFASGGTLSLRGGQQAIFSGLPAGVGYTVTEADYTADGYTAGVRQTIGQIAAGATADAVFTNHKTGTPQDTTTLIVQKQVEGDPPLALAEKSFSFVLSVTGVETAFSLKNGEEKTFSLPYGSEYEVRESDAFGDGFALSVLTNGAGTAGGGTITATATNTYTGPGLVVLTGEKTWDLSAEPGTALPQTITVLLKHEDTVVHTKTVAADEDGRWLYIFEVPKYEADGVTEIEYTIEETPLNGYLPLVTGTDLVNTRIAPAAYAPRVEKIITGDTPPTDTAFVFQLYPNGNAPAPATPTASLTGAGEGAFPAIRFTAAGRYTYTITEQPGTAGGYNYDATAWTLTVQVALQGTDLQVTSAEYTRPGDDTVYDTATFVNNFSAAQTTQLTVTKHWVLATGTAQPAEAQVQLYRNGLAFGTPVALHSGNSWRHTFTGLDNTVVWTVDEVDIPAGFARSISGNSADGFVITNTALAAQRTTLVSGTKTWVHGTNPTAQQPASITVLVKNGSYVAAQKTVTAADSWRWNFTLPRYDAGGAEITYTIDEVAVPGYTKQVNGYNLTNTFTGFGTSQDIPTGGATPGAEGGGGALPTGQTLGTQTGTAPQTGDPSLWPLWLLLMAAGPFALRFVLFHQSPGETHKRRRKQLP